MAFPGAVHTNEDPDFLLFDAILDGDLNRVRRLVKSGVNKNVILHFPEQWEGASVLGTSAFEGQLDIVRYLVEEAMIPVDFQDPCLGRTPLHWACLRGHVEVIDYLLDHGADIDHQDKNSVTPIIRAAAIRNIASVKALVDRSCSLESTDTFGSSALHYACFFRDKEIATLLIKAGCIVNTVSALGQRTPLASLVFHNDMFNCRLLLEAGYRVDTESWIRNELLNRDTDSLSDIENIVLQRWKNPLSLQSSCRIVIRHSLSRGQIQKRVDLMKIPLPIKQFLLLD